ncbi:MAG TPA: hypothetical protein VJ251_03675 [Stellaceae bacterium]|nr:hypothetical protein [Stellaceae bacterium]
MRIIPVPSFDCVDRTAAGRPPRASAHFADFVVVRRDLCLVSFSSVEASPQLMPTADISLETEAAGVEFS